MKYDDLDAELNTQKRQVDFNTYDITIKELISMVSDGIIDIAPAYQRQFRWDPQRQSVLVESIFLGIPVPPLFMATNPDGSWEVIDGVQRLSSIINFVADEGTPVRQNIGLNNPPLTLAGIKKLQLFNGCEYNKLPRQLQLEFLLKPLKIITLSDKSDKSVRFDLFERLNTGGIKLSSQEIRSCIYKGRFNDLIKRLSIDPNFIKSVKLPKSLMEDGTKEELVLRFFAYLNNKDNFDHSVIDFLNEYMEEASKDFDYKTNEDIFHNVFAQLSELESGIVKKTTIKKTSLVLYEAVSVGAALAYKATGCINITNFYEWVVNEDFNKSIIGSTNSKPKIQYRIDFCKDKFSQDV